jgi:hypothetical protein
VPIIRQLIFVSVRPKLPATFNTLLIIGAFGVPDIDLVWHIDCPVHLLHGHRSAEAIFNFNIGTRRKPPHRDVEEKTMPQPKVIRTNLGDLIVAVTDEVMPFVHDPASLYAVVSFVLSDVLAHYQRGVRKQPRGSIKDCGAETLN